MISSKFPKFALFVILFVISPLWAEDFDYEMAKPVQPSDGYEFYQAPAGTGTLKNIDSGEIRNVILCIGDGIGPNHVALTRHHVLGPGKKLYMERLPVVGLVRTFSADNLITDSAASGTAMACGIKTHNGMIGMAPDKTPHISILQLLHSKGWRTGLVATSEISHATPAAFVAHVTSRNDQSRIAEQMLQSGVDILFGGGAKYWKKKLNGKHLFEEARQMGYQVTQTKDQMNSLTNGPAIGLFANEGMTTFDPEPSLAEMTQKAIELLSRKSGEWFSPHPKIFLMIEGSQIDWASHANDTDRAIRQILLFDMAVQKAVEFALVNKKTLVIVTADHETGGLVIETETLNKWKIDPDWEETGHTAADVPLYAFGPGSKHFSGVMDNTEIPKRIAGLLGIDIFPVPKHIAEASLSMSSK
jgi:alkaline phosphatase